ncbi:unnamed protein product, partial [Brachionus calyciflorus]
DQFSSYYINDLNNNDKNEIANKQNNSIDPKSSLTNELEKQDLEFQNENEVQEEKIKYFEINSSNPKKDLNDELLNLRDQEEKLEIVDNLPSLISNEPSRRYKKQVSASSEISSSLSTNSQQYPVYYELKIKLISGKNLAIRDLCGSSDPYAKFLLNGVNVHKSKIIFKNLNPEWNEDFSVKLSPLFLLNTTNSSQNNESINNLIMEPYESFLSKFNLKMFVYDYDRGFLSDDLIGYANIDLTNLKVNVEETYELELEDEKLSKSEYLGLITLDIMLVPKFVPESVNESKLSSSSSTPALLLRSKRAPYQLWQCVLNVILIECNNLLAMDENGFSDPYVKFRLENERYRSKTIRRSLNPRFLEQFQLYIYDTNKMQLNISVYDYDPSSNSDDFIGSTCIDLKEISIERTNFVKLQLENNAGTVSLLLTVTGIYEPSLIVEDYTHKILSDSYKDEILKKYSLFNSMKNMDDIGWLRVKVLRADGLASADINGKSDPFCCLQLINDYVQTHTVYKNLNPEWDQVFEFKVIDLHSVLEITVLDEDKNKVYEFLGKIEIPLTNIQNGKKKVYPLKDKKLLNRAKGSIELEMELIYNPVKAVIKTFNPRDVKFINPEPKLKVPVLKQNIMRVHNLIQGFINTGNFIDSCFRWVYPTRSILAFICFVIIVLNFEIYMLPLALLMIFLKNYLVIKLKEYNSTSDEEDLNFDYIEDEEENLDPESKEPKKSFRERLNEIQEICLKVQETLDYIASLGERIINTFLFTTPWLSWLAIIVLIIISIILYIIPVRYLILAWGVNKFTKKFRKPADYVDNTEILDFLSRVPSKKELFQYREYRIEKQSPFKSSLTNNSNNIYIKNNKKKKV